jgi:UDP-N-acetylglucosamine 2-epimerase (non-hydrolysing)
MKSVLFVFGTRPEAIKLAPVIRRIARGPSRLRARVCVTAQHRSMLDQALACFGIRPDYDLNLMRPGQTLADTTAGVLAGVDPILAADPPSMVVVQGDTTTTMAGALAAFYRQIPVAHVEAGLRTNDLRQPFPEEWNRIATSRLAALHFAPTERARNNLLAEGVPGGRIFVTGNSGVDAVLFVAGALEAGEAPATAWPWLDERRRLILVTAHRRESFGSGMERICAGLAALARREDVQIVYPVHRNPNVLDAVTRLLGPVPNVFLLEPLEYRDFIDLMRRAALLLTDSGGIQEEAPSLGKPVLVLRETTERPEAVEAGTVRLVGSDPERLVAEAEGLLDDPEQYRRMSRIHNPYGDGHAAERIAGILEDYLCGAEQPAL